MSEAFRRLLSIVATRAITIGSRMTDNARDHSHRLGPVDELPQTHEPAWSELRQALNTIDGDRPDPLPAVFGPAMEKLACVVKEFHECERLLEQRTPFGIDARGPDLYTAGFNLFEALKAISSTGPDYLKLLNPPATAQQPASPVGTIPVVKNTADLPCDVTIRERAASSAEEKILKSARDAGRATTSLIAKIAELGEQDQALRDAARAFQEAFGRLYEARSFHPTGFDTNPHLEVVEGAIVRFCNLLQSFGRSEIHRRTDVEQIRNAFPFGLRATETPAALDWANRIMSESLVGRPIRDLVWTGWDTNDWQERSGIIIRTALSYIGAIFNTLCGEIRRFRPHQGPAEARLTAERLRGAFQRIDAWTVQDVFLARLDLGDLDAVLGALHLTELHRPRLGLDSPDEAVAKLDQILERVRDHKQPSTGDPAPAENVVAEGSRRGRILAEVECGIPWPVLQEGDAEPDPVGVVLEMCIRVEEHLANGLCSACDVLFIGRRLWRLVRDLEQRGFASPPPAPPDGAAAVTVRFRVCALRKWLEGLMAKTMTAATSETGDEEQRSSFSAEHLVQQPPNPANTGGGKRKGGRKGLEKSNPIKLQIYQRIQQVHKPGQEYVLTVQELSKDKDFTDQVRDAKLKLDTQLVRQALAYFDTQTRNRSGQQTKN